MRILGLDTEETRLLQRLNTPEKLQNFIDTIPMNFETHGETYMSPRMVLRERKAHCMEGALLAATALWLAGEKPLLMDLKVKSPDVDHAVALYRKNGLWGAISKTNHASVRFRDPIYRTLRELALSYFHEYFLDNTGEKTLRSWAGPFDLSRFGTEWITSEESTHFLVQALDDSRHYALFPASQEKYLRKADSMERKAGALREWK